MENEYEYNTDGNEYTIWWVNEDFVIDCYDTVAKTKEEAIIDFFRFGVEPSEVKNYTVILTLS